MKLTSTLLLLLFSLACFSQTKSNASINDFPKPDTLSQPSVVNMEEIIITSNHTQLTRNIPYTVHTVSNTELQKTGATTLVESLGSQPGVNFISGGGGIGKPVIRGLGSSRIVLYSMGTKIENQQWDDDHDAGISDAGIDRVEIIYGPSALLYGADALGGAVVFVDEKPAPTGKMSGNVNTAFFSNTRGVNSSASLRKTYASGFFYMAHLSEQSHADYRMGAPKSELSESAPNSRFNNFSTKLITGVNKHWGTSKLTYSYLKSLTGLIIDKNEDSILLTKGSGFDPDDRKPVSPSQQVSIHVISSENTFNTKNSKWNLNASTQINNRKEFEPVDPGQPRHTAMGLLLHTYTYTAKWSSNKARSIGVMLGTQGMLQKNKNFGTNIAVPDADINDFAGFSLLSFRPADTKWNFLGGLRYDIRSINVKKTTGVYEGEATLDSTEQQALSVSTIKKPASEFRKLYSPFSFSIGAIYNPAINVSVKANLVSGFSAPNYAQLSTFGKHEGTNIFEVGNSDLQMEQNLEADASLLWETKNMSLNISGFYNHIKNYIFLSPTQDSIADLQVIKYMQEDAEIHGGEFSMEFEPENISWLELEASYSLGLGKSRSGYLSFFPANKFSTGIEFEKDSIGRLLHPSITFSLSHHFSQNRVSQFENPTDGYSLFDISMGTEFRINKQQLKLSLMCTNLFNKAYFNHLSIVKDIGIYERGRNLALRLLVPLGD